MLLLKHGGEEGGGLGAPQRLRLDARLLQRHAIESDIELLLSLSFEYLAEK